MTNGYRGDSLRAWKQNSGGKTYFLYAGSQPVCELGSTGSVTATNTFGPSGPISRHTSSGSVFYAFDYRNSVAQRLNSSGTVLSSQTFDAYGTRLSTDGNSDPYAGFGGQAGYYTDWETGTASSALELLTFRYYDPAAGRFLNRDPIGHSGGANEYEYVNNGPTGTTDPSGLEPGEGIGEAIGACLGAFFGNDTGQDKDPCYNDYNECMRDGECLADLLSSTVPLIVEFASTFWPPLELITPFLVGCLEGAVAAGLHTLVEDYCEAKHSCHPDDPSWECSLAANLIDVAFGCMDGVFANALKNLGSAWLKQFILGAVESYFSGISNLLESSGCGETTK